jgi:hypothetical protein
VAKGVPNWSYIRRKPNPLKDSIEWIEKDKHIPDIYEECTKYQEAVLFLIILLLP